MKIHGITGSLDVDGVLLDEQQQALDQRQAEVANRVLSYWEEHGLNAPYPLAAMPTGFGKSRVMHSLIQTVNAKTLLIVGTKNILLEQNKNILRSKVELATGESDFSILPDMRERVVLTTWQGLDSYVRSFPRLPEFGLIVIDEVHNAGTVRRMDILNKLKPQAVIGLTATAFRSTGKYRAPEDYKFSIVDAMTLPECIDHRWLSPLMGLCMNTDVVLPRDVLQNGNLNNRQVFRALRHHPDLFCNIAIEIGERFLPSGMKTIIIVNRVHEEACVMALQLQKVGYKVGLAVNENAARTLSSHGYDTMNTIERYQLPSDHPDSLQVLISPQVISEGFDAPATECVVWASPTFSSLRYTQVMGRGARRCPGKKYCLVVDYVYLIDGYGYSMNFAQFFKKSEIKRIDGGVMYVGPTENPGETIPAEFTRDANIIVNIADLQCSIYLEAGEWKTTYEIAHIMGCTHATVQRAADTLDLKPEDRRISNGHVKPCYPPEGIELIRQRLQDAGEWRTVKGMTKILGYSQYTIQKVAKDLSLKTEDRRIAGGHIRPCYSPEDINLIKRTLEAPMAGEWKTVNQIVQTLAPRKTVQHVIDNLGLKTEERRTTNNMLCSCYSPEDVELIKKAIESAPGGAGDWKTVNQMVEDFHSTAYKIKQIIVQLNLKSQERRIPLGRVCDCYSPRDVETIKEAVESGQ